MDLNSKRRAGQHDMHGRWAVRSPVWTVGQGQWLGCGNKGLGVGFGVGVGPNVTRRQQVRNTAVRIGHAARKLLPFICTAARGKLANTFELDQTGLIMDADTWRQRLSIEALLSLHDPHSIA